MQLHGHDIAVCSWSLQPKGLADLAAKVQQLGLQHVQLALGDLLFLDDKQKHQELGHLRKAGIIFTGGMLGFADEDYSTIAAIRRTGGYVPDDKWPVRKKLAAQAVKLAGELGIRTITSHIGFVPAANDSKYATTLSRVRELAQLFKDGSIDLLMETGQEPAHELRQFLTDLAAPNVHINFDPANMILYGAGNPIEAVKTLGPHIRHVHVKDAVASAQPGEQWGEEVPFGTGQVGAADFLSALKHAGYRGPLAIEREAGSNRVADVQTAIEAIRANG
jgi:sugar phosphate isomerase/epimerase